MAGVIADVRTYMKWLTTTALSVQELNLIISQTEAGMQNENWQVHIIGNRKKVRKVRLILDNFPNGEDGNGNGGNHNGNV